MELWSGRWWMNCRVEEICGCVNRELNQRSHSYVKGRAFLSQQFFKCIQNTISLIRNRILDDDSSPVTLKRSVIILQ